MAAEHDEGVGAQAAAGARVRHAEDVGERVALVHVAEEEEARAGAARQVLDRERVDAGAAEEGVGCRRRRLPRRDVVDGVAVEVLARGVEGGVRGGGGAGVGGVGADGGGDAECRPGGSRSGGGRGSGLFCVGRFGVATDLRAASVVEFVFGVGSASRD